METEVAEGLNVIWTVDFGCAPKKMTPIRTPARGEAGIMTPSVRASRLGRIGPGRTDSASWRTEKLLCLTLLWFLTYLVRAKPGLTLRHEVGVGVHGKGFDTD